MKVLHIINSLATGGAEKLLVDTIELYCKKNIDLDILVINGTEHPFFKKLKKNYSDKIFSLGKGSVYNPLNILKIIPYLKKYDLIHVHLFPAQYWVVLAKIISSSSITLITTEHSTSNTRVQHKFFQPIERFIYSFYSRIVCITPQVRNVMLSHLNSEKVKLAVIENGVDIINFTKAVRLERQSISINLLESDILLIMVAGFRIQKDHETVLKAMVLLNQNVKLLLVGDGEKRKEIEQSIISKHLSDRVFILGIRMDVPQLLKMCDISILSSHWEGFGLVAVEGMASGKPFLASDVPGLREIVKGAGILFPQGDDQKLAEEIRKLMDDKAYYNRVSAKCVERASNYDIKNMVDQTIDLYKEILSK